MWTYNETRQIFSPRKKRILLATLFFPAQLEKNLIWKFKYKLESGNINLFHDTKTCQEYEFSDWFGWFRQASFMQYKYIHKTTKGIT